MTPRDRLASLEHFGIKLGLDTIGRLLAALGSPHRAWTPVHVAGTNGKGSVTAMVERALRAAGHRTGRYTSPHLHRLEERFAIDGAEVRPEELDAVLADVFAVVDRLRADGAMAHWPTYFEATTAAAFELFRRAGVGCAVIEVGLGGRFDATNVLDPIATCITTIAFDHERHLGRTLAAIAGEKAGIARPGVPMVAGRLPADALAAVAARCADVGAPLTLAHDGVALEIRMVEGRHVARFRTPRHAYPETMLALAGRHQVDNAVVALRLLETCDEAGLAAGPEARVTGLAAAEWPARLEWVATAGGRVLLDAAHNPAGAAALAAYLADAGLGPLPVVLAIMADKDVEGIVAAVAPGASRIVASEVPSPRCLRAAELAARARAVVPQLPVDAEPDPMAAVARALAEGGRAAVAGSIFLVGPLRARLQG
ncbi:MAG: cyanophycin synthetase [Acidobacteriota bacterium]